MLELGFSQMLFGYGDIRNKFKLIAKNNIKFIEIRGYPPRIDYTDMGYLSKLKSDLLRHKIEVVRFQQTK